MKAKPPQQDVLVALCEAKKCTRSGARETAPPLWLLIPGSGGSECDVGVFTAVHFPICTRSDKTGTPKLLEKEQVCHPEPCEEQHLSSGSWKGLTSLPCDQLETNCRIAGGGGGGRVQGPEKRRPQFLRAPKGTGSPSLSESLGVRGQALVWDTFSLRGSAL